MFKWSSVVIIFKFVSCTNYTSACYPDAYIIFTPCSSMKFIILHIVRAAIIFLSIQALQVQADEIKIAVASNFMPTIAAITSKFEQLSGHKITLIPGSTGKHYAQIINGAPYDAFFAADISRPLKLEQQGVSLPGSRFTYAIGQLVLWSPDRGFSFSDIKQLPQQNFRFLAIANPELAPYGRAARQVLKAHNIWDQLARRMVRGENIGQAFHFVQSGNAQLGFIANSQLKQTPLKEQGTSWLVPQELYDPIEQQAVLLNSKKAARDFIYYCRKNEALEMIRAYGYHTPDADK